jgi:NAD(P)-dependent dehydrogenase (short-subunit alcohol dehydrogenase family)
VLAALYPKGKFVRIDRKVLIVGGSSGIGLNLSSILLDEGFSITIASRSVERLNKAKEALNQNVSIEVVDASDEKSVMELANRVGEIDHLVVTIKPDHLTNEFSLSDTAEVRNAFDGKFWGQYYLARHCLSKIKAGGSITLTSGIASRRGYRGFSGTAAINGAIESFVASVAGEISPIRINAVCPGFIESKENDVKRYSKVQELGSRIPLNRLGRQREVSEAYLYLMNNTYSTGTTIVVDGGELSG